MSFADTHVHFHFPDYDKDRLQVMNQARQAGVKLFINVGTDVPSSQASLKLAEENSDVYATAGVHPHDAKDAAPEIMREIEKLLAHPRMVAVGEVGLDYYHNHSPKEVQIKIFREFIQMHRRLGKTLVIHCRDAYDDMHQILKEEKAQSGIMHCFSSDKPTMEKFLDLGFYISFAGPLTYKKNDALREAAKACPIDRLLLETDAPFLPPQSKRGKRNESGYLVETAATAAELHGLSLDVFGEKTSQNARKAFHLC